MILPLYFCMEDILCVFLPEGVFYLVTVDWILTPAFYVMVQSINQPTTKNVVIGDVIGDVCMGR